MNLVIFYNEVDYKKETPNKHTPVGSSSLAGKPTNPLNLS